MTPKQQACLRVIAQLSRDGVSPTYEQIGAVMGVAKSRVHEIVHTLAAEGFVEATAGRYRSLCIRPNLRSDLRRLVALHGKAKVQGELATIEYWDMEKDEDDDAVQDCGSEA